MPQVLFHRLNTEIHAVQHIAVRVARRGEGHILQFQDLAAGAGPPRCRFPPHRCKTNPWLCRRPSSRGLQICKIVSPSCRAAELVAFSLKSAIVVLPTLPMVRTSTNSTATPRIKVHQRTAERDKKSCQAVASSNFWPLTTSGKSVVLRGFGGGRRCALPLSSSPSSLLASGRG